MTSEWEAEGGARTARGAGVGGAATWASGGRRRRVAAHFSQDVCTGVRVTVRDARVRGV